MRRVLGILTPVLAVFALGLAVDSPASAATPYPPATPLLTTPTPTTTTCAPVTLTASGFPPGATVTFTIAGAVVGTAVANASGVATLTAPAPCTGGTYTVVASSPAGPTVSLTLTVVAPGTQIPATGSNSRDPALVAGVLILVGLALIGVAAIRRRNRTTAATH